MPRPSHSRSWSGVALAGSLLVAPVGHAQVTTSAPVKPTTSAAQGSTETETGSFRRQPRDESLQSIPPATTGAIEFIGNRSYTADQLKVPMAEQIKEIDASGLTPPRADDAAYYLAVYYRKQGFAAVDVTWKIAGRRLLLTIKEGPRTYLRKVTFIGNKAIDRNTLYEYMIGGTEERTGKQAKVPFVEDDMGSGAARIRGYYESEGRLDAKIDDPVISYSSDRAMADVSLTIAEGPRYTFGEVAFVGDTAFDRTQLLDALGEPLSNPYTTQRLNTMEHNLLYFYKLHGYFAATVEATADPKKYVDGRLNNRRVPATFTVKAGPVYHFDGMTVTGLDRLKHSFFEHRFAGLTGKVYTPTLLDEKFREILRTGLFKNLRISTVALPTNEVRADFIAEEAKAKEVGFSIGFSSYEGAILGLRLADRDLGGNGRPLSLQIDYSQRGPRAELLYLDPWLFESSLSLRSRIFVESREEIGYTKLDTGLRFDLTRKLNTNVEFGAFLQGKNVNVDSDIIDPIYLGATSYQVISLGITQSFDYRDSPVNPSKGWIVTSAIDTGAIAGELAYGRATARVTLFQPVFHSMLLALGARGGAILPVTEIPIEERFFNGGATTVRSFRERRLGPREPHGNPIGGEVFSVFNAELTFPIKDALRGAVFADAGNLLSQFSDAGVQDMRYGIGLGLRYNLPIGPVRLDVAANPDRKMYEEWGAVHFSFGFAF